MFHRYVVAYSSVCAAYASPSEMPLFDMMCGSGQLVLLSQVDGAADFGPHHLDTDDR